MFRDAPMHRTFEGNRWSIERDDGTIHRSDFKHFETVLSIKLEEIPRMSLEEVLQRATQAAEEIARQQHHEAMQVLDDAIAQTGNSIDASAGFTAETYLDMIERVELRFDSHGEPCSKYTFGASPETLAKMNIQAEMRRLETEPLLRERGCPTAC